MEQNKKQIRILIGLGVVLVAVWGPVFFGRSPRGPQPASSLHQASPASQATLTPKIKIPTTGPRTETANSSVWGGNPFEMERRASSQTAPAWTSVGSTQPVVSGIVFREPGKSAIGFAISRYSIRI